MIVNSAYIIQDSGIALNIFVRGLEEAVRFYQAAFGAQFMFHEEGAGGSSVHARFRIGNSLLNVSTDSASSNQVQMGPSEEIGSVGTCFELFATDVDAALKRALRAGATVLRDRTPGHFGDDCRFIVDPFGYVWCMSMFINDAGALCV